MALNMNIFSNPGSLNDWLPEVLWKLIHNGAMDHAHAWLTFFINVLTLHRRLEKKFFLQMQNKYLIVIVTSKNAIVNNQN